ncbi:ZP domain-containing protein-like [Montipora foliosa]|uniref:ZP domain-containing protein-like n=1 Tax=Montipora foliosa TaxID=591990 RepID=UPI0035F20258
MMIHLLIVLFTLAACPEIRAEEDRKKVTVDCAMEQMSVHIERTLIPGFRLGDLHLRDKNCLPTKTANSSHVTITTPLTGCGTTLEHRDDYLIYRNVVKDGYAMNAIIGRLQVLEIPFECIYLNEAEASLVEMNIQTVEAVILTPQDGSGAFELKMNIFKSENYLEEYSSFPLPVTLMQRMYFQVSVDTPDTRLGIVADMCYVTPMNSLSKKEKHDIIVDRCPKDDTVIFHSGPSTSQRFSFEAFQFLNNQVEPYLYVHCEVELCNLTDFKPSCLRDCDNKLESRRRRAVNTDVYDLEQGPIVILRNYEDSFEDERVNEAAWRRKEDARLSSSNNTWLLVVMGFICVICFCAVIHTVKKAKQDKPEDH